MDVVVFMMVLIVLPVVEIQILWFNFNENHTLDLQHLEYYNITVRAYNQLGQSLTVAFLRVQTKDVPIRKEG